MVDEQHIRIAARGLFDGLAGADGHDVHVDAGGLGEFRQDVAEQAGVLRRCRRRDGDEVGRIRHTAREQYGGHGEGCKELGFDKAHGAFPFNGMDIVMFYHA